MAAKHRLAVYFPLMRRRLLDESKDQDFLARHLRGCPALSPLAYFRDLDVIFFFTKLLASTLAGLHF